MVKNTNGGNKSKGIARKHISASRDDRALRLASCDLEKYGVITKILGNGMFYVATDLSTDASPHLLGHIRKKFKGRSKRDNSISLGSLVLVGLREWELPNCKECDLLEVYDNNDVRKLTINPSIDLSSIRKHFDMEHEDSFQDFAFSEERDNTFDHHISNIHEHGYSTHTDQLNDIVDILDI